MVSMLLEFVDLGCRTMDRKLPSAGVVSTFSIKLFFIGPLTFWITFDLAFDVSVLFSFSDPDLLSFCMGASFSCKTLVGRERLDFSGELSDGVSLVFVTGVGLRFDPLEVG
jgi:hypothetical protein